jgi:predicted Zn-dependent protease
MRHVRNQSAALLAVLLLIACATRNPGDPINPGYNVYSPEQDVEIGRQAAAEVRQQVDIVDNPALQSFVRAVGGRLAQQPEAGEYPYEFTLINERSINAFALPGGPIFIHSGLLEAADTEGQLAGVLAHEISHVALRHGTSQASKASIIQLPAVLAGAAIGDGGALGQLSQLGIGLGLNALMAKYSRSAEKEADALGTRIMMRAGYDPVRKKPGHWVTFLPKWLSKFKKMLLIFWMLLYYGLPALMCR